MLAYIIRRLVLVVPTLFGIMVVNFIIVQAAPGGPVEQMIARIKGTAVEATARVSGAGQGDPAAGQPVARCRSPPASTAAPGAWTPSSSRRSNGSSASTSQPTSASSR